MPQERRQTPGTVTAYISTYGNFLNFLFLEKEISAEAKATAETCLASIRKTTNKQAACRKFEMLEKETEMQVSSDDIHVSKLLLLLNIGDLKCNLLYVRTHRSLCRDGEHIKLKYCI